MSYQVLARKYRPQSFSDVIGQDHVTRTLRNAIEQGRIAHGYIFSGHRGIGKTTIARILAMALNCRATDRPNPDPCGQCASCQEVRAGSSVDVIEIDAATNRGIDEIRELRDAARYRPARDRFKIYILDEAHQITEAAFNALLKTLEEPPDHVVFMMATTQPEDIPQTIRSRCQHFSFHAVAFDDIVSQLSQISEKEGIHAEPDALAVVAEAGDGSMRDALSILDQAIAGSGIAAGGDTVLTVEQIRGLVGSLSTEIFEEIMGRVADNSAPEVVRILDRLLTQGVSPGHFARQFVRFLRNVLMAKIAGADSPVLQISPDERTRAQRVAEMFGEEEVTRFLSLMLRTYDDLGYRQEQRFHLELGVLKLVHAQRLLPFEQLLSQNARPGAAAPVQQAAVKPAGVVRGRPEGAASAIAAPSPQKADSIPSPFEADRLRKSTIKSESPVSAGPQLSPANGIATGTATALQDGSPEPDQAPLEESSPIGRSPNEIRDEAARALESARHTALADLVAGGSASFRDSVLEIGVSASPAILDLSLTAEAKRVLNSAAATCAGRTIVVRLVPGTNGNGVPKEPSQNGTRAADVQKALEEPVVKHMQETFGARVLQVVDLRRN